MHGTSATTFAPGNPVLRQDSALMLYRFAEAIGADILSLPGQLASFPDGHDIGEWAEYAMNWAVYHGLIRGIGDNLAPWGTADRAQAATLLHRLIEIFGITLTA